MEKSIPQIDLMRKNIEEFIINKNRPIQKEEILSEFNLDTLDSIALDSQKILEIKCKYHIKFQYKENNSKYYKLDVYYFSLKLLEEFWNKEIELRLIEAERELSIKDLTRLVGESLINYYGFEAPVEQKFVYDLCDAGFGKKRTNLINYIEKNKTKFYISQNSVFQKVDERRIGLTEWIEKGKTPTAKKIIKNAVISVLREPSSPPLTLDQLTHRINRKDIKAGIPKPFDKQIIQEIISADKDRFHVDNNSGIIKLSDDLEYIAKYFKENQQLLQNFDGEKESEGIIAIIYIGKDFPLQEAKEYVYTRPIIYLYVTGNLALESFGDDINISLEEDFSFTERLIFNTEFGDYLRAIIPSNLAVKEWLQANVSVSFYEESYDELRLMLPKLLEKFSPVLNVDQNPGNLFQYTLNNKLELYKQTIEPQKSNSENQIDIDIPI
jgi:hypothetical protein